MPDLLKVVEGAALIAAMFFASYQGWRARAEASPQLEGWMVGLGTAILGFGAGLHRFFTR